MQCPENQRKFYEAFYGIVPQQHVYRKMHKEFERMMQQFKVDVSNEFPEVESEVIAGGLISGLEAMREKGAERPTVYFKHEKIATCGFKAACSRIRKYLKSESDKKRAKEYKLISEDELRVLHEAQMGIRAGLMVDLEKHIQQAIASGIDMGRESKVVGFCSLLEAHPHPEGYAYVLLGLIIPNELEIYYADAVVDAMNAHPSLRTMKRKSKAGPLAQTVKEIVK